MDEHKTTGTTYRRPKSDEARLHRNAYRRAYNAAHPDRVKAWRAAAARRYLDRTQEGGVDK